MRWQFLFAALASVGALVGCGPKKPAAAEFGPDVDCVAGVNKPRAESAPADKNAAVKLLQALGPQPDGEELSGDMLKWLGVEPPPEKGEYWLSPKRHFATELEGEVGQAFAAALDVRRTRPWKAAEHPRVEEWLSLNAKPFVKLKEAAELPAYYHPLVPAPSGETRDSLLTARLTLVSPTRDLCRAVLCRAMLHAGEGRTDDAWNDELTVHRVALHLTRGGTVIEYVNGVSLIRDAVEAELALLEVEGAVGTPDARRVREFVAALQVPTPATVIEEEKHVCRDVVQHFRKYGHAFLERVTSDEPPDGGPSLPEADERKKLDALDWAAIDQPCRDHAAALAAAFGLPTFEERQKATLALQRGFGPDR